MTHYRLVHRSRAALALAALLAAMFASMMQAGVAHAAGTPVEQFCLG